MCFFHILGENDASYKLSYSDSDLCLTGSLEVNAVFNNGDLELYDILYIYWLSIRFCPTVTHPHNVPGHINVLPFLIFAPFSCGL